MTTPPLLEAARELLDYLESLGRPACLIGGMVVARWGEPRATRDVDATVLADFGEEAGLLAALLRKFPSRDPEPLPRAEIGRLALLTATNGVQIDLSFAAFPFEREVLDRASTWRIPPDTDLRTCSPEDLVIYKLVAGRPNDLVDVSGIVRRQGSHLDAGRIRYWGQVFAEIKEDPDLLRPFEQAMRSVGL
jgi:hypothetical protein